MGGKEEEKYIEYRQHWGLAHDASARGIVQSEAGCAPKCDHTCLVSKTEV